MNPLNLMDRTSAILQKSLDLRAQNQQVIASNIANAETPGYSPAKLDFEDSLRNAIKGRGPLLATTHPDHISVGAQNISDVTGTIIRTPDNTGIGDENGVSIDEEMVSLSENQIMYETSAQLWKKKLTLMKYVVADGK